MAPLTFSSTTRQQQRLFGVHLSFHTSCSCLRHSPFNMGPTQEGESADHKTTIETVEDPSKEPFQVGNGAGKDRAAELLGNTAEHIVVSEADNKRILRRIDLTLLPIMLGVYFLQQLDKSTLSYASVFGLITVSFWWIEIHSVFEMFIFVC